MSGCAFVRSSDERIGKAFADRWEHNIARAGKDEDWSRASRGKNSVRVAIDVRLNALVH